MPKRYAPEFRRALCARLVAGEKVSALSKEVGVSEATLYLWKRQALIDAGRAEGVKSFEADELARAYKTIAELEAELEITKQPSLCSTARSRSAQKAVPGRQRPERPGVQRKRGLPGRGCLSLVLLRVQVPRPL
jgi:transposase-like protein